MKRAPSDLDPSEGAEVPASLLARLPCAICGHRGQRPRAALHMTHGITIWLCDHHRSDEYMKRRSGREFVERLAAAWAAAGMLTIRRQDALHAHHQRIQSPSTEREQPGSYSWPQLRREAERRYAAGEPPAHVIHELRQNHREGPAMVPSIRTMRRWFTQARWLTTQPNNRLRRSGRSAAQIHRESQWEPFINLLLTGHAWRSRSPLTHLRHGPSG